MTAELLLPRRRLQELTGLSRNTVLKMLHDPATWAVKGGTKRVAGQLMLPLGFYNRWLATRDLAPRATTARRDG